MSQTIRLGQFCLGYEVRSEAAKSLRFSLAITVLSEFSMRVLQGNNYVCALFRISSLQMH